MDESESRDGERMTRRARSDGMGRGEEDGVCKCVSWLSADKLELERSRLGCSHDGEEGRKKGEGRRMDGPTATARTDQTAYSGVAVLSTCSSGETAHE